MPTLPGCEGPTQTQQKLARSGGGALAEAAATETKARSSVTTAAFILERRSGGVWRRSKHRERGSHLRRFSLAADPDDMKRVLLALALAPCDGLLVSPLRASAQQAARASEASMAFPRVVVTGMGIVSCLGTTLDEVKDSLYNCKSGLTFCNEFADIGMKSQVSGMPDYDWCARALSLTIASAAHRLSLTKHGARLTARRTIAIA